jgi:hypothetical protein
MYWKEYRLLKPRPLSTKMLSASRLIVYYYHSHERLVAVEIGGGLTKKVTSTEEAERAEARALKLVGVCFIALAAYVSFDSAKSLLRHEAPDKSYLGIVIISLFVMPFLAREKRKVAKSSSRALEKDGFVITHHQTAPAEYSRRWMER